MGSSPIGRTNKRSESSTRLGFFLYLHVVQKLEIMEYVIQQMTTPTMDEIRPLYMDAGWTNYTNRPAMLEAAYAASLAIYGAYLGDDRLIGVLRAVGDGASIVYIQDILVHSTYQRRGVGRALMEACLAQFADVYQIVLLTEDKPETIAFYASFGFVAANSQGCLAFVRQR